MQSWLRGLNDFQPLGTYYQLFVQGVVRPPALHQCAIAPSEPYVGLFMAQGCVGEDVVIMRTES